MKFKDDDVVKWMLQELKKSGMLYQDVAAGEISLRFGRAFVYVNENGNEGISKSVLAAFKKLTGDAVVWERGERAWRMRQGYDSPGRQQP